MSASSKEIETKLHAAWKVQQSDGLGSVYYFYPDGVLVIQCPKRREYVQIGKWELSEQYELTIYDLTPKNTSLSAEQLEEFRRKTRVYSLVFDTDTQIGLIADDGFENVELKRRKDLPDRNENLYWGFQFAQK